jgi:hypothetical protein
MIEPNKAVLNHTFASLLLDLRPKHRVLNEVNLDEPLEEAGLIVLFVVNLHHDLHLLAGERIRVGCVYCLCIDLYKEVF